MGVLYILDEPSIGLHQRDNAKLIATLTRLRDLGNTVLVVEHDEETIRTADWVDRHRARGGRARRRDHRQRPARGGPRRAALDHRRVPPRRAVGADPGEAPQGQTARSSSSRAPASTTSGSIDVDRPARDVHRGHRRVGQRQVHARHRRPLPGPGARAERVARAGRAPTTRSKGAEHIDKIIEIDQSPIGRTPRSNPATYTGLFGPDPGALRRRPRGARPRLLAGPVLVQRQGRPLRELQGRRDPEDRDAVPARRLRAVRGLQGQALQPRGARDPLQGPLDRRRPRDDDRRGARVLLGRAERQRRSSRRCTTSGWATSTSASRRRRCRAARRSGSSSRPSCRGGRPAGRCTSSTSRRPASTSPTSRSCSRSSTGSSTAATRSLVIEHNLDVIKTADWIVDLGPEGGARGGQIIAEGTPEKVAATTGSATGEYLARVLRGEPLVPLSRRVVRRGGGAGQRSCPRGRGAGPDPPEPEARGGGRVVGERRGGVGPPGSCGPDARGTFVSDVVTVRSVAAARPRVQSCPARIAGTCNRKHSIATRRRVWPSAALIRAARVFWSAGSFTSPGHATRYRL